MMRFVPGLALALFCLPVAAQDSAVLERALADALATLERALPKLATEEFGVDVAAYRDALGLQQFGSAYWGGAIQLETEIRPKATGSCGRFAAFVRMPPENGAVRLVLCPQFFSPGADALRELTVLHEMVHVVAGPDECQAMALAARIEVAATGAFTPVDAYWRASGCVASRYSLPD